MTLTRARRVVTVVDAGEPRNAPADGVHRLLALEGVKPSELLTRGRKEVLGYGGDFVAGDVVDVSCTTSRAPRPGSWSCCATEKWRHGRRDQTDPRRRRTTTQAASPTPRHHPQRPRRAEISTLSRLEAGLRLPTLEQLLPLARAYGVTLDELVDAPQTGDPRINMRPLPTTDGRTIVPLTRRPGGIQAYKFVLPAGHDDEPHLRTHAGLAPTPALKDAHLPTTSAKSSTRSCT